MNDSHGRVSTVAISGTSSAGPKPGPVPLLDVGRGNRPLREEFLAAIAQVVDSGRFLHGPEVKQLEEQVAEISGARHAVACASGSDALLLALMAIGIGPGDEVLVPSFTFFATASAVWRLGARPVFVDIDATTFNMDPEHLASSVTDATKAVIPVHLFGQCADMDAIRAVAKARGLVVIEDAAQAIGARFQEQGAGSLGDMGCFSFYPTKNLGGFGDGGMLTTDSDVLAEKLRLYAGHGMNPRYYHRVVGINSRLDTIQAAVLNVKMKHLATWTEKRQANAARYDALLRDAGLDQHVTLPHADTRCDHVWNQYTIRVSGGRRDAIRAQLAEQGVGAEIYYPVPLHRQQCFATLGWDEGSLPRTELAAREVLSLPIYPELTAVEQETVVATLAGAFRAARKVA